MNGIGSVTSAVRGPLKAALLLAFLAAMLATRNVSAAEPLAMGATLTHELAIGGKRLPLPDGPWLVAANTVSAWNDRVGGLFSVPVGAYGYVQTVLLFRVADGRVDTIMEVNSNALPASDGWGIAADCSRDDLLAADIRYKAGWDGLCYFVTHSLTRRDATAAAQAAGAFAAANGWALSDQWLTAGIRATNRSDVIDMRFLFSPESRGFFDEPVEKWQDSLWSQDRIAADPARVAWRDRLGKWASAYADLLEMALTQPVPPDLVVPRPEDAGATPVSYGVDRRMAALQALKQDGTITERDFQAQVEAMQREGIATSSKAPDPTMSAGIKGASYRVIVTLSHVFVNYYWTGAALPAGILEVLQIVINSTKFYFHELAWARFAGGQRADTARYLDFDYVSTTQPTLTTAQSVANWVYGIGRFTKIGAASAWNFAQGSAALAYSALSSAVDGTPGAVDAAPAAGPGGRLGALR